VEAARDADLFICESYFFDKKVKNHLDYSTLAAHRTELSCRRMVLTHMSADMLQRLSEIDVEVAEDGLELVV
jgi:ribonuclease BN (tRNA processing enzyme)